MNIIETENLSYKYDESHFALSDLSIGFEKAYLMQNSLNMDTSEIISTYVYKIGLLNQQYSYSTAINLFNSVINLILMFSVNTLSKKLSDTSIW